MDGMLGFMAMVGFFYFLFFVLPDERGNWFNLNMPQPTSRKFMIRIPEIQKWISLKKLQSRIWPKGDFLGRIPEYELVDRYEEDKWDFERSRNVVLSLYFREREKPEVQDRLSKTTYGQYFDETKVLQVYEAIGQPFHPFVYNLKRDAKDVETKWGIFIPSDLDLGAIIYRDPNKLQRSSSAQGIEPFWDRTEVRKGFSSQALDDFAQGLLNAKYKLSIESVSGGLFIFTEQPLSQNFFAELLLYCHKKSVNLFKNPWNYS